MTSKLLIVLCAATLAACVAGCSNRDTPENWRLDLRELERLLAERHVDLYHTVTAEEFAAAVDDLSKRIPVLTRPEILVGIARVVAMVGDGHTSFYPSDQPEWRFRYFPIQLYEFADGIYLTAAAAEYSHLFGKRLVRIDDTPIDEAYRAVTTTIAADNDMEYRYTVPFELIRPELLCALGIADSTDGTSFSFEDGVRQTFAAMDADEWLDQDWRVSNGIFAPEQKSPSTRMEFLFASTLTRPFLEQRRYYWYTWLEEERALFLQYNACWDQKDQPTFAAVIGEMFASMDDRPVERLIIDLRQNSGGEPLIAEPLVAELEHRPEFGAEGRLFVLTGRRTNSAALTNAADLRRRAGARIVGEPPRGKPNSPSEGRDIDLGRTKIWATVSTQFVERDPTLGSVDHLPVDIPAVYTFEVYARGEDPILEAALNAPVPTRSSVRPVR